MSGLKQKLIQIRSLIKELNSNYLGTTYKKFEFSLCVTLYWVLAIIQRQYIFPENMNGIIAQMQSFTAIYLCFRFSYSGFFAAVIFNLIDITMLAVVYSNTHSSNLLIGMTMKVFTIISTSIVAVLVGKESTHKKTLQRLAITDELTSVYNQRHFHSLLDKEIARVQKSKGSIGLILVDIDNFKTFNDVYGHDCGDNILKETAVLLDSLFRNKFFVCRYGGDEFAVILPDTNIKEIESTAHYIKEMYSQRTVHCKSEISAKVTLSMGLSEYPNMSGSKNDLISHADMALYHAKNLGKDKVHFYQDIILQLRKSISSDHQQLIGVFKTLLSIISAKDKYTLAHSERVSAYAVMIGNKLCLSFKDISILQYAGLLHDIGKIEIPRSILNKVGRLTDDEFELIRKHPVYSANMLEPLEGMDQLIEYVRHHHERFDGKGYPDGLAGKDISLGARILCVADSFDAMLSERPYSRSMTAEQAFRELEKNAGTQFDPIIVRIFIDVMKEKIA